VKRIAIIGATGSIGQSALAVVDAHAGELEVVALAAGENAQLLAVQIEKYRPRLVAMSSPEALRRVQGLASIPDVVWAPPGRDGLVAVASHPDVELVLFASAGTDGLEAVLAAIDHGKTIALANKEILVMAGSIVTAAARRGGVAILPVDSEHNAIHQCLYGRDPGEVKRLVLTASGGPFRGRSHADLLAVTAADALQHPTWRMGRKITIDSATLMNKGLEVIEARWLFDVGADQIDVLIHPQSVVHSMVEFVDGSLIAQLGLTDMRLPIQYAFSYPHRWTTALPSLDLARAGPLEFAAVDTETFPCLGLAYRALTGEGSLAVVLNATNEVAVAQFLEGRIAFTAIARLIEMAMDAHRPSAVTSLAEVRSVDRWAREYAQEIARGVESKA
jgi:1-deoxy-D-xylulose-5-phosphate reductoisomerase